MTKQQIKLICPEHGAVVPQFMQREEGQTFDQALCPICHAQAKSAGTIKLIDRMMGVDQLETR